MEPCIFIILFFFGYSFGERKLKFVTVLYRHGDRSAVSSYPNDTYKESDWPQGFGQLSKDGMRQHFELGQFLRKRYTGFLSESYTRYEIAVRSTDFDRTLMSAASNLAGLYPPSDPVFPGLKWQPIPIHTVPHDEKLLSFPLPNCLRYQLLMKETEEKSEIFLSMTKTYEHFMEMVKNEAGLKIASFETMWSVYDTLLCEKKHGLPPPAWVTPDVMKTLRLLRSESCLASIKERKNLCYREIIKNLTAAASSNSAHQLKMIMYSTHDTTIVALQEALDVYNGLPPPYASCHIFELYQEDNGSFSVEMFYRNDSSVTEPYHLPLPGCAQPCLLNDFINLTKPVISKNWEKDCQISSRACRKGIWRASCSRHGRGCSHCGSMTQRSERFRLEALCGRY